MLILLLVFQTSAVLFFCYFHRLIFSVPEHCGESKKSNTQSCDQGSEMDTRQHLVVKNCNRRHVVGEIQQEEDLKRMDDTPIHGITVTKEDDLIIVEYLILYKQSTTSNVHNNPLIMLIIIRNLTIIKN